MHFAVAVLLAAMLVAPRLAVAAEWLVPPVGYAFAQNEACAENAEKASKPTRPGQAVYAVCADQMALLAKGIADAKAGGKLLLVTFGATWCPWCATLQKRIHSTDVMAVTDSPVDFEKAFHHIEIGLSTLHKGQQSKIPSGDAALKFILEKANGAKIRVIPFLAIIDPASTDRVYARNLDDVMKKDGGFDFAQLRAVLVEGHDSIRRSKPASAEPGWLMRKWKRLWQG